jgi:hypothetical protein
MDKSLKRIINETVTKIFEESPEKMVEQGVREVYYDICPHCKVEIHEKHEYTTDGGLTWRHAECGGLIARPETPLEEIVSWLQPYVQTAREERNAARKALGLPPSGEVKYSKQEPGGTFSAANSSTIGNV